MIKGILGSCWLVIFFVIFFSQILPNSGKSKISRLDIWSLLPDIYIDTLFPSAELAQSSGWRFFPQRFDILFFALIIYLAAWALGSLILRAIKWNTPQTLPEKLVIIFGLGLSGLSLLTLILGKAGFLNAPFFYLLFAILVITELWFQKKTPKTTIPKEDKKKNAKKQTTEKKRNWFLIACLIGMIPFLAATFLGAMLPSIDFDVREYHLQGPKEFYQNGQIGMLPHNVYTSFPFLTEMLSLLAIVLKNDWYWGAVSGKAVLMGFAPLTALALYAAGTRWFSKKVGWIAALIFLTTPWTYRISIIAYAEGGLTFYLFASLFALMLTFDSKENPEEKNKGALVTGLLAGSAMACKYPGVVQVVIPIGLALIFIPLLRKTDSSKSNFLKTAGIYSLGVLITIGPWLLKNTVETGNPVYPLLYSVFGGKDWDEELNTKWKNAHSPKDHKLSDLAIKSFDVTTKSDWLSPLLFGLAPLAFFSFGSQRKQIFGLAMFVLWLFLAWWILTHRLDRFWVPLIPVVALLAGVGFHFTSHVAWKITSWSILALALVYNLGYITTELCGYNGYLTDYNQAEKMTESLSSGIQFMNHNLTEEDKVLCVGMAAVFDARIPILYNTVFDDSIFEEWFSENAPDVPHEKQKFKSKEDIIEILNQNGITHLVVNWSEILRYRNPGSYGYTEFVQPERFKQLQEMGILSAPRNLNYRKWNDLEDYEQKELNRWGQSLKTSLLDEPVFISTQIFNVQK